MTHAQQALFAAIKRESPAGLLHALLDVDERRVAAELVALNLVKKGRAHLRRAPVAYFFVEPV